MTLPTLLPRFAPLALALALASAPLAAQEIAPTPTATPAGCAAVDSDAARLACYDRLFGRNAPATAEADAAAQQAAQSLRDQRRATRLSQGEENLRARVGDIFRPAPDDSALANAGRGSLLDSRWELAEDSKLGPFQLRAYKPVYLLPAFWTSDKNQMPQSPNPANSVTTPQVLDSTELKFQISFKTKIAENLFGDNGDIWAGYTQSSRWQAYNAENSRPFRETNYEPEVMMVFRNGYSIGGWRGRMTGISLNHQSNGRPDPLSRSWNRVMLNIGLDRENWALVLRPWYRIPESRSDDNNPDIEDYMGRGDATLIWNRNGHEIALMARHSLRTGDRSHGALQLDYGFPISNLLRGHIQVFDGYGESMIDYNHKATYVGVGVSLLEWF
ncbi:phospholipase [Stenotrophomonas sp. SAU14A_NAIMI4_5]|uniref:phospholipase A n=1 Tax=Stenotrophomonas sp. SAU14A_NAIMI4_5 TaxID=2072413 RepID=UPI000D541C18|nr:phospholipase A [Stenotrophomonas sp. SAU14A_NAIMI4_5]AWH50063.1 phospholipase [Stenotrophomonas sp. SAU14A_NAIMI4_5]